MNLFNQLLTQAQPTPPTIPDISKDINGKFSASVFPKQVKIEEIVPKIFNEVLGIAGLIFLLLLLFGGFSYLLGAGNEEKTGKAKKLMIDAVIGLVITTSAYGVGTMIIRVLMTGSLSL